MVSDSTQHFSQKIPIKYLLKNYINTKIEGKKKNDRTVYALRVHMIHFNSFI